MGNPYRISHKIFSRHVSAKKIHLLEAPSLLKHDKLYPDDKLVWDSAYHEEYQGLVDIDTWELITDEQYQTSKAILGRLMPTMATAVIKKDGEGQPVRAKYRIVVLCNLDPHSWFKSDCFAPVVSQVELRLLIVIAV